MAIMKKAKTPAERTRKSKQLRRDANLKQIKVWVSAKKGSTEADRIRAYAAKLPETKAILDRLK